MKNLAEKFTKGKVIGLVAALVIAALVIAGITYVNDYYSGDMVAIEGFEPENTVEKQELSDNMTTYLPENAEVGFIFYPGGKVEAVAYEPLMEALASEGILSVLIEMPFNLAVLDIDAAEGVQEQFPDISEWYIGGHSLGGSMAASYLAETEEQFEGLVLLGSYSTADLSEGTLDVLSVYGSEDEVMNREKYLQYMDNLPEDFTEVVIEGGCHAYFGMYGAQAGDGVPVISNEEQIAATVQTVVEFVRKPDN